VDRTPLAKTRALVADESTSSCELLCAILEESGMQVLSVCCWSSVLDAARVFSPDVVLLDVSEFGSGSRATIAELRAMPAFRRIPLIALAPSLLYPEPHSMVEAGFAAVLVKPISPQRLRKIVQQQLDAAQP
jgi:CheY-like chemotaxis protein